MATKTGLKIDLTNVDRSNDISQPLEELAPRRR